MGRFIPCRQWLGLPQVCDTVITFYRLCCFQVFVFNLLSSIYYLFSEGRFSWCLDCIGKCCDQSGFTASATLASTPLSRWMRASSWISSSSLNRSLKVGTWPHSMGSIVGIGRQQWAHMLPLILAAMKRLISWLTGGCSISPAILLSFGMENWLIGLGAALSTATNTTGHYILIKLDRSLLQLTIFWFLSLKSQHLITAKQHHRAYQFGGVDGVFICCQNRIFCNQSISSILFQAFDPLLG